MCNFAQYNTMAKAQEIIDLMTSMRDPVQSGILSRFFKTGKGEYGEGDKFLGIRCPQTRSVVKAVGREIELEEVDKLLASEWHEIRLCGFLLLVEQMQGCLSKRVRLSVRAASRRRELTDFYLAHSHQANNWDLVDMSCPKILGNFLLNPLPDGTMPSRQILYSLAASDNLWDQRIAVVTNWMLIRAGEFDDLIRISDMLLPHPHDLIHKAVGWMLREMGKESPEALEEYLSLNHGKMSRTTLRYAIEKLPEPERQRWMRM